MRTILFSTRITGYMLTATAALLLAPVVRADTSGGHLARVQAEKIQARATPGVLPPTSVPFGRTYEEWSQEWWVWALTLPVSINPLVTGDCNPQGQAQSGHVWFLWGVPGPSEIGCAVPPGKALFIPIINSECSNVEAYPYAGPTPDAARACAKAWNDDVRDLAATIDGVPVSNVYAYRFSTRAFSFRLPEDNLFGLPRGTVVTAAADGYYLMLAPLSAGRHTIHITGKAHYSPSPGADFSIDTTLNITVGK